MTKIVLLMKEYIGLHIYIYIRIYIYIYATKREHNIEKYYYDVEHLYRKSCYDNG
jgi:hypothetical protein